MAIESTLVAWGLGKVLNGATAQGCLKKGCMYRGRSLWRCPWEQAFQLGEGEGPIGLVGPISQPRGTIGNASLTLDHTCALM